MARVHSSLETTHLSQSAVKHHSLPPYFSHSSLSIWDMPRPFPPQMFAFCSLWPFLDYCSAITSCRPQASKYYLLKSWYYTDTLTGQRHRHTRRTCPTTGTHSTHTHSRSHSPLKHSLSTSATPSRGTTTSITHLPGKVKMLLGVEDNKRAVK